MAQQLQCVAAQVAAPREAQRAQRRQACKALIGGRVRLKANCLHKSVAGQIKVSGPYRPLNRHHMCAQTNEHQEGYYKSVMSPIKGGGFIAR